MTIKKFEKKKQDRRYIEYRTLLRGRGKDLLRAHVFLYENHWAQTEKQIRGEMRSANVSY